MRLLIICFMVEKSCLKGPNLSGKLDNTVIRKLYSVVALIPYLFCSVLLTLWFHGSH
jgi:hypothetical protein